MFKLSLPNLHNVTHPFLRLSAIVVITLATVQSVPAAEVGWRRDLQATYREATSRNKPILVVVGATWCGYCRQLHQQTLRNAALVARINDQFLPVLIDADEQAELTQQLQVDLLPAVLVISPERRILSRSTGFQTVAQLDSRLAAFKPTAPKSTAQINVSAVQSGTKVKP